MRYGAKIKGRKLSQSMDYKYALSLTSQFYFCGVPFRLDTTPKCFINCAYCFAMARGGRRTSIQLLANVDRLKRLFSSVFGRKTALGLNAEILSRRVPVHFGGLSDPFASRKASKVSKEMLRVLRDYDYPVVLSTKNATELLRDDTIELLQGLKKLVIQISIISSSESFCKAVEPLVIGAHERVECMRKLSKAGFYCICRVQPLFVPQIENICRELVPMLSESGCRHVIVEHLKLPVERKRRSFDQMLERIGWDAYSFYRSHGMILAGREWLLNNDMKWTNLQPIIEVIRKHNMTYGAGDYGLYHLGDTACCCGISTVPGFAGWFRGNISNTIRKARPGILGFDEITKRWSPESSIKRILNSNCRTDGATQNVLKCLWRKWNSPGTTNSPDAFLGVNWHGDYDSNGNCLYIKESIQ